MVNKPPFEDFYGRRGKTGLNEWLLNLKIDDPTLTPIYCREATMKNRQSVSGAIKYAQQRYGGRWSMRTVNDELWVCRIRLEGKPNGAR